MLYTWKGFDERCERLPRQFCMPIGRANKWQEETVDGARRVGERICATENLSLLFSGQFFKLTSILPGDVRPVIIELGDLLFGSRHRSWRC